MKDKVIVLLLIGLALNMNVTTKILIFTIGYSISVNQLSSQTVYGDSIIALIEKNKFNCPAPNFFDYNCTKNWFEVSVMFDSLFFIRDSNLINYLTSNSNYIFNDIRNEKPEYIPFTKIRVSKDQSLEDYNLYLNSLNYADSSNHTRYQIALLEQNRRWLSWLSNRLSLDSVCNYYGNLNDTEACFNFITALIYNRECTDIKDIYSCLTSKIRTQKYLYSFFVKKVENCYSTISDSLFLIEKTYFDTIKNLNDEVDKIIWEGLFLKTYKTRDSIRRAQDSIRNLEFSDSLFHLQYELAEPIEDSVYKSRLDSIELNLYLAMQDTTLGYQGIVTLGDDGTNFNSFSNSQLIDFLENLNIDTIYNQHGGSILELNSSTDVIYLRKILQIVGDRILNNTYSPIGPDSSFLSSIIETYVGIICDTPNVYLMHECKYQLLRLWPLLKSHVYQLMIDTNKCKKHLGLEIIVPLLDETMVNYFVAQINSMTDPSVELESKLVYFEALSILLNIKDINPDTIPPRRPARSYEQAQPWIDNTILPVFIQYGYRY
jgi:hypothetical protein